MKTNIKEYSTFVQEKSNEYMFFQNLKQIQQDIQSILNMDQTVVSNLLKDGHAWAIDHVATSKDDIEEVANWLVNNMK